MWLAFSYFNSLINTCSKYRVNMIFCNKVQTEDMENMEGELYKELFCKLNTIWIIHSCVQNKYRFRQAQQGQWES